MDALARFIHEVASHHNSLAWTHQHGLELHRNGWLEPAYQPVPNPENESGWHTSMGFYEDQSPPRKDALTGEVIPKPPLLHEVVSNIAWKNAYSAALQARPEIADRITRVADVHRRFIDAVCEASYERRSLNYEGDAAAIAEFGIAMENLLPFAKGHPNPKPPAAKHRLSIDVNGLCATLDDKRLQLKSTQLAVWLEMLNSPAGAWVSASDAKELDNRLLGTRTDTLRKQCPEPIQKLLETSNKSGCRLKLG